MDPVRASSLLSRPTSARPKSPSPPPPPSNDDIEAVIQMATASRQNMDGRSGPPKDTRTQLFVGNLPYRVRWQDLKDLFRRAGTVLRADVSLGPDNRSRGYGTVLLATAEDAGRAIDMFHGYSWQTRILEVRPDRLPPDFDNPLPAPAPKAAPATLAFPPSPSNTLTNSFASSAHITSPSGAARNLPDDFDYNSIYGPEALNVSSSSCRSLFVGNLPFHCQWQDLKDLFRQAGTIMRADVALGPDGRSRGFGTVVYATEQDAERAVKIFNGYEYNGRVLKVHFDRYSHLSQSPASPSSPTFPPTVPPATMSQLSFTTTMATWSSQLGLPIGYQSEFLPSSRPSSPYDLYHMDTSIFAQSSKSPQRPSHSQSLSQSQDISSHRSFREGDSESNSNDMDSISTKMASVRLGSIPPLSDPRLINNKSRSSDATPSDAAQNHDTSVRPPQPQPQRSEVRPIGATGTSQNQHPHHPGPISLPPPSLPFPVSPNALSPLHHPGLQVQMSPIQHPSMGSPLHHPAAYQSHQQLVAITPLGLPPITPSMPPFIFHPMPPPASPTTSVHATSPAHMPMYGGTASFSPTVAMSPGAFWGRPGNHHPNPLINPAVGAPVHVHSPGGAGGLNANMGGSAYFYAHHGPGQGEPAGYFDPAYFPPGSQHPTTLGHSGLVNEILNDETESVSEYQGSASRSVETLTHLADTGGGKEHGKDTPSTDRSTNDDDDDDHLGRSRSQDSTSGTNTTCTTSWYNSEESCDEKCDLENQGSEAVGTSCDSATSNGGDLGAGIFPGERKTVSRARSMSGDTKSLFSGTYKAGPGSGPPVRTTSSGQVEPPVAARSPSAQEGRSLHLQC